MHLGEKNFSNICTIFISKFQSTSKDYRLNSIKKICSSINFLSISLLLIIVRYKNIVSLFIIDQSNPKNFHIRHYRDSFEALFHLLNSIDFHDIKGPRTSLEAYTGKKNQSRSVAQQVTNSFLKPRWPRDFLPLSRGNPFESGIGWLESRENILHLSHSNLTLFLHEIPLLFDQCSSSPGQTKSFSP